MEIYAFPLYEYLLIEKSGGHLQNSIPFFISGLMIRVDRSETVIQMARLNGHLFVACKIDRRPD
jgi:hypothetical protein